MTSVGRVTRKLLRRVRKQPKDKVWRGGDIGIHTSVGFQALNRFVSHGIIAKKKKGEYVRLSDDPIRDYYGTNKYIARRNSRGSTLPPIQTKLAAVSKVKGNKVKFSGFTSAVEAILKENKTSDGGVIPWNGQHLVVQPDGRIFGGVEMVLIPRTLLGKLMEGRDND